MSALILQHVSDAEDVVCAGCGRQTHLAAGVRLCVADPNGAICRECAGRQAPALAALVELARVAERIGRIQSHSSAGVPMESLLQLAWASEHYFLSSAAERRHE